MLEIIALGFLLTILTIYKVVNKGTDMIDPISAYLVSLWLLSILLAITNLVLLTKVN
jgi:hypothetical protein